jgi:hypothetical protein
MKHESFEKLVHARRNMVGHVDEIRAQARRLTALVDQLLQETAHCLDYDPPLPTSAPSAAVISAVDLHVSKGTPMTTATITITLPTTRTDGAALTPGEIDHIDIFDANSTTPAIAIGTVKGPGTTFVTGTLSVGAHAFTAVVNDTTGHIAAPSNVATVTVLPTLANPSPATISAALNPDVTPAAH